MIKQAIATALIVGATAVSANAQFPGITLPNNVGPPRNNPPTAACTFLPAGCGNSANPDALWSSAMPTGPGFPVSDVATEGNTYIIAISESAGGMYGGFDPTMALATDLQQQVSSAGGLPLDTNIPGQYPAYWPGYTNANYGASYAPNSPEGNMAITLGTLQGTLQAGADQQNSQIAELNRLEALEAESAGAAGVLQALEVGNEINLFGAQQDMKLRNATNAQLNALVVAESNRQNKEAQDQLESLGVATEVSTWDATNTAPPADPQIIVPPWSPQ